MKAIFQILFRSLSYLKYCNIISPELIQTEKYFAGSSSFFPIPTPSKLCKLQFFNESVYSLYTYWSATISPQKWQAKWEYIMFPINLLIRGSPEIMLSKSEINVMRLKSPNQPKSHFSEIQPIHWHSWQFSTGTHHITTLKGMNEDLSSHDTWLKFQVITCPWSQKESGVRQIKKPSQSIRPRSLPVSALLCCQYSWNKFPITHPTRPHPFTRMHFFRKPFLTT